MKRTVKYALSAAMAAVFVVPAFAQSDTPFPDTKENHWAYEAVTRLKTDGILVGYPNGMFIGNRLATRYEMAVAINAAYTKLKNLTDGLSKQIDDINGKITELQGRPVGVSQADFDQLKASLNDVKDQVAGMKSYASDIADLKRLSDKFGKDLAAMGVDVDDMKKSLSALDSRVKVLEAHRLPIDIHGDVNFYSQNSYSTNHTFGVDVTGRPEGVGRGSRSGFPTGADEDFTFLHEAGFDITTNNEKGPKGEIVAVIGDMLDGANATNGGVNPNGFSGGPFPNQSTLAGGVPFSAGNESVYIQKAVMSFGEGSTGLPFHAQVGRIGLKLGSYIFERPDFTPYFANDRWDNGEWAVDGAKLGFKLGMMKLAVFAGTTSNATDTSGLLIQPMGIGGTGPFGGGGAGAVVNQVLGAHLWVPIGKDGNIDLAYVLLDADTFAAGGANHVADYGVDVDYKLTSALKVWGGYSKTDAMAGTHNVNNKNDQRYDGYFGYDGSNWGVTAGYRKIEPKFAAPGFWGRIGTWWNPTDIQGADVAAHIDLAKMFALKGTFEYYTGTGELAGGLQTGDKITRGTIDLGYKFGSGVNLDLGFEDVIFNAPSLFVGKPEQRWYNVGASYDLSENAKFSVLWQMSDSESKGNANATFGFAGSAAASGFANSNSNKGGLITTQFSIKF